ncbi:alkaline shock response membrane anchor protein AmaP [Corynebacterium uberis]|uniref:alkaline shock response membrane anchor protein AmaP n=1 Tax=Corynebacterium TaxID=1716 RepID=UPI001D09CAED|nr:MULTISPECIES: alkaline shock response membrane anchor protein AmaP [Corynebacterium]MCZ9309437.1 alkaline shock response membrane anchor protein AmaP [Corynebacterium sp. c6VSa_13]UDL72986.1 alkaline shock response membrane anchor protein AmaP [Corynebacterium uberis]UDL76137.1 alkaline shock response membrane anchor protein AmaP [Corynebacterium uberis]UDL78349.1 alkaline shock response membrane anchor protein AmaP [Corynebacterium uberis]UDL80632.1 alkaline shock response membrane anchor 
MSRGLAGLDRTVIFLLSLIAIAAGLWGIGVWANIDVANQIGQHIDAGQIKTFQDTVWYEVTLWAVLILGVILGIWWILANLNPRGFNRVRSSASNHSGAIDLALQRIASAVDEHLEELPRVNRVNHKVAMDRSRPTIAWTVNAEATADLGQLRQAIEQSERDFRTAVRDVDVDTVYKLHLSPVES